MVAHCALLTMICYLEIFLTSLLHDKNRTVANCSYPDSPSNTQSTLALYSVLNTSPAMQAYRIIYPYFKACCAKHCRHVPSFCHHAPSFMSYYPQGALIVECLAHACSNIGRFFQIISLYTETIKMECEHVWKGIDWGMHTGSKTQTKQINREHRSNKFEV